MEPNEKSKKEMVQKNYALIREMPKLVPLTEAQKEAFKVFWATAKTYERRRDLVSQIPDLYNNRMRYRDACLLPESEDWDTFNRITRDPETRF